MTILVSFVIRLVQAAACAAPYVILGLLAAGVLRVMVRPSRVRGFLNGDAISEPLRGWLFGLLLPVCSLGVLPVCRELLRMGVSRRTVFGFLLAAPLFHPLTLALGLSVMDISLLATLLAGTLVVVVAASQLVDQPSANGSPPGSRPAEGSAVDPDQKPVGLRRMLAIAIVGAEELRGPYLLELAVGLLGAGLVGGLLQANAMGGAMGQEGKWAGPLACSLGSAIYMTPEHAISVLDRMFGHGNSLAAAFALLVCGVGLNLGTLLAIRNLFGLTSLLRGLAVVFVVVMGVGMLANATVYRPVLDAGDVHAGHEGEGHTHAFDNFSRPMAFSAGFTSFSQALAIARNVWPPAGIGAALLVCVWIGLGAVVRSDRNRARLQRLFATNSVTAATSVIQKPLSPRWLTAAGIGAVALALYCLLLVYFPNSQTALAEMRSVHADAQFAVRNDQQLEAHRRLEEMERLTRGLPVGSLLRGTASGDHRVSAQQLRQRIGSLRAALDSGDAQRIERSWSEYEDSYQLCRGVYLEGRVFMMHGEGDGGMPDKIVDAAERELYLTPGGIYTEADIVANGRQTASERFAGFRSAHDMNPPAGSMLCPITATKANSQCTWTVNGKVYQFCCPPCVDEFVRMAKSSPEQIKDPEEYVKQ